VSGFGSKSASRRHSIGIVAAGISLVAILPAWGTVDAASAASAVLKTDLPNHTLTPGYLNPAVARATINRTMCIPGWTAKIGAPSRYTTPLKIKQLALYGYADRNTTPKMKTIAAHASATRNFVTTTPGDVTRRGPEIDSLRCVVAPGCTVYGAPTLKGMHSRSPRESASKSEMA
jgi:hypothetical protein